MPDPAQPLSIPDIPVTQHGRRRLAQRGVRYSGVLAAFEHGRIVCQRGACIRVIGRKEVVRTRRNGIDISVHEGVHVVCSLDDGAVLTVYRNRDLQLRPHPRRRSRRAA